MQYEVVTRDTHLNVRSSPSASSSIVRTLPRGSLVEVIGSQGEWYKLLPNGWGNRQFLRPPGSHTLAVIVVPGQGNNVPHFQRVASALNEEVYGGRAQIIATTVTGARIGQVCNDPGVSCAVTFRSLNGQHFDWSAVRGLQSVVIISHGGSDGPNLASHAGGFQPWGRRANDYTMLTPEAITFWHTVRRSLGSSGKVILVGCLMGPSYARLVARTIGKPVFASVDTFHAAVQETVVRHLSSIEAGQAILPMQMFGP
jgi:hypothetical protein